GLHYRARQSSALSVLGWIAFVSGIVFLVTDYGETVAQFIQLTNFAGDDGLALFASTLRPIKMFTWTSASLAVLAALIVERFAKERPPQP
ncbi:MAG: hypothetical protein AAGK02_17070, partial [Pseudomonadota bacterium]